LVRKPNLLTSSLVLCRETFSEMREEAVGRLSSLVRDRDLEVILSKMLKYSGIVSFADFPKSIDASVPDPDPDLYPPGPEIIWSQGSGSRSGIIHFGSGSGSSPFSHQT